MTTKATEDVGRCEDMADSGRPDTSDCPECGHMVGHHDGPRGECSRCSTPQASEGGDMEARAREALGYWTLTDRDGRHAWEVAAQMVAEAVRQERALGCGACAALQAQLDAVAAVLGADALASEDGYHYLAVSAAIGDAVREERERLRMAMLSDFTDWERASNGEGPFPTWGGVRMFVEDHLGEDPRP